MSSSNEIDIVYAPEVTTYGVVDPATDFETVRKTSEGLSGTPEVSISNEARKDRQSGGQILVGLEVGGPIGYELSASKCFDDFIEAGMMKAWVAKVSVAEDMDIDAGAGTIDRALGDFVADGVLANSFLTLTGFDDDVNNTTIFIVAVAVGQINFIGPSTMVTNAGNAGAGFVIPKNTRVGTTRFSFGMEKQFTDIGKQISYSGMRVDGFSLETKTGEPVVGEFSLVGADYDTPAVTITDGHTVNPAGSAQVINSTVDMGVLVIDGAAVPYCVEGMKISLTNNMSAQKCIGKIGPKDQIPFEASISVDVTAHLDAVSFGLLADKIAQTKIGIGFNLRDGNGLGYAIYLPSVQLSFPDPAMSGKNAHVMINATGVASYDETKDNTMIVSRLEE